MPAGRFNKREKKAKEKLYKNHAYITILVKDEKFFSDFAHSMLSL